MADWQDIGKRLQGMGEGFAGRGSQWRAAEARERESRAYADRVRQQDEDAKATAMRKQSMGDAAMSLGLMNQALQTGDVKRLQEAGVTHLRALQAAGATEVTLREAARVLQDPEMLMKEAPGYIQLMGQRLGMGGEKDPSYSAKTLNLADGSVLQTDSQGGTRLVGPDGQAVTDPAMRAAAIQSAMQMEQEQARKLYQARAAGTATGKGEGNRQQEVIDVGLRAAQQIPILNRNKQLLEELNTGGFAGAGLRIKNALGIEGADEAELTTNMARTVLGQLRDTFGAQFTEREGARLERIEAGIGKSTEGNKRIIDNLIQMATFKAERAASAAKASGDYFTVREIDAYMEMEVSPESSGSPDGQIKILSIE